MHGLMAGNTYGFFSWLLLPAGVTDHRVTIPTKKKTWGCYVQLSC
jgi:hypothetical protein